jgi:pyruvate dehydrogenase complex dehydrogenase (E1) component
MAIQPSSGLELQELARKTLWLACWTVHNANHLRDNADGLKVGGHQASCASMVDLMTRSTSAPSARRTASR